MRTKHSFCKCNALQSQSIRNPHPPRPCGIKYVELTGDFRKLKSFMPHGACRGEAAWRGTCTYKSPNHVGYSNILRDLSEARRFLDGCNVKEPPIMKEGSNPAKESLPYESATRTSGRCATLHESHSAPRALRKTCRFARELQSSKRDLTQTGF